MREKKILIILTAVLLFVCFAMLGGCSSNTPSGEQNDTVVAEPAGTTAPSPDGDITLHLLFGLDLNKSKVLENQVEYLINRFEDAHENVTVEIEYVPNDTASLDIIKDRLRTEIMAGKGPDMFLLPTHGTPSKLIFDDVNQAMHNGIFADISACYNADTELDKDGLNQTIMDAGVVDGARYTLPLRCDFPVVYVDLDKLGEAGLDTAMFENGVVNMLDIITQTGDKELAAATVFDVNKYAPLFFSDYLDYEQGEILVNREELIAFWNSLLACREIKGPYSAPTDNRDFLAYYSNESWTKNGAVMNIGPVQDSILESAFSKADGINLAMYPMTGQDGKVNVFVNYYAAVSAGCAYPELAYEFIRQFLTVESQFEQNARGAGFIYDDMVTMGYAVRMENSASAYYETRCHRTSNVSWAGEENWKENEANLKAVVLTDEDVPILNVQIDSARYPAVEAEYNMGNKILRQFENNGFSAEGIDVESIVDEFLEALLFHLGEG